MKLTFLGTGTSFGVPQIGCSCAVCRSPDPRDRRTRSAAVVETDSGLRLLIDTPPELRLQLITAGIDRIDAVLFTHEHADHTHGIDDLRAVSNRRGAAIPMYGPAETLEHLAQRFPYIFDDRVRALPGTSKPEAQARAVHEGTPVRIGDVDVIPVAVPHGTVTVFGYRIGPLGYVTDASQPGCDGPGYDGQRWLQRAAVSGLVDDPQLRDCLVAAAELVGLTIVQHDMTPGRHAEGVPVTRSQGRDHTAFGRYLSVRDLRTIWPPQIIGRRAFDRVAEAWQLTLIDPEWGREDVLWEVLAEVVR